MWLGVSSAFAEETRAARVCTTEHTHSICDQRAASGRSEAFPVRMKPYPSETIIKNSCVNGFARMGSSFGPAALIAGVVMWASIAA
jgi:hypothetical protein